MNEAFQRIRGVHYISFACLLDMNDIFRCAVRVEKHFVSKLKSPVSEISKDKFFLFLREAK